MHTLHFKHCKCQTAPRARTKAPSKGKEHETHVVGVTVDALALDAVVLALDMIEEATVDDSELRRR